MREANQGAHFDFHETIQAIFSQDQQKQWEEDLRMKKARLAKQAAGKSDADSRDFLLPVPGQKQQLQKLSPRKKPPTVIIKKTETPTRKIVSKRPSKLSHNKDTNRLSVTMKLGVNMFEYSRVGRKSFNSSKNTSRNPSSFQVGSESITKIAPKLNEKAR